MSSSHGEELEKKIGEELLTEGKYKEHVITGWKWCDDY